MKKIRDVGTSFIKIKSFLEEIDKRNVSNVLRNTDEYKML